MPASNELEKQLNKLRQGRGRVATLPTKDHKYLVISDMHLGNGSKSDDFKHNENLTQKVLEYYNNQNYKLILLGDIEELWQFSLDEIVNQYQNTIYKSIRAFGNNKIFRIYGNHDLDWKISDPIFKNNENSKTLEAIRLKDSNNNIKILLVHGHQGTPESDKWSWISRPIVKAYGKGPEQIIKIDKASSATKSPILKSYERKRYNWAKKNHVILICGHSHRAFFASKSKSDILRREIKEIKKQINQNASTMNIGPLLTQLENKNKQIIDEQLIRGEYTTLGVGPYYFNSGCALYSDGITVIEIANDEIKLVKWHRKPKNSRSKFEVYGQANLSEMISKL